VFATVWGQDEQAVGTGGLIQGFFQTLLDGRVRIIGDTLGHVEASVPQRRPASGRIRAMEYRVYLLLEAPHAM
jgi:hypothetical protein